MTPALEVRDLAHAYGPTVALAGVTLDVQAGERFGLLGPNGSGKTTLFRAVSALLAPDAGTVRVDGHGTAEAPGAVRQRLGVVFQTSAIDPELTVREGLRLQAALVGLGRTDRDRRIGEVIAALGLADKADARVGTLSGGLVRRADLARGLLHRPRLLLLDEPTTGLDPTARRDLWDALDRLRREGETAQVVATHLMDEAERCDRIAILDHGRVVALGTPDALKDGLGADTLWLDLDDDASATALADRLRQRGLDARPVGRQVLVVAPDPAALLPVAYAEAGVRAAAVRRPSLDDVFAVTTGRTAAAL